MTNKEIDERGALLTLGWELSKKRKREIVDVCRRLVSQAYEEAARAVCPFCAAGQPLQRATVSTEVVWSHVGPGYEAGCAAFRIHELKAALVGPSAAAPTELLFLPEPLVAVLPKPPNDY